MKYFTKDWYDEMKVSGFLTFPETEEQWEEDQAGYREQGIDPAEVHRRDLEDRKEDLLKFLPESFHPYIYDGTINSKYPTPELRNMADRWEADYEARFDALLDDYSRHYESIKEFLPPGAIQLTEKSLHDCVVKSVDRPSYDELVLLIDCSGGFHYFKDVEVKFTEVSDALIPEDITGAWWLYNEIYLSGDRVELHVLFDTPITEVTIICKDIQIEELE
ncbi:DUF4085 family protein [Planococcus halotolerans]|uniref:DUF4085 domain-containing protein n=1 Tax=Planococcus halotolerans TaxID=2233542 RepID=A0A365KWX3_9BACL|nr:DUF4085 family protein [Planococcus halotolerans]QHJ69136.1 DUF4085 family protein [Planococcus halotolerans]RAZ77664.1 hypothetical protein DP120_09275 [Planococcus halotolerans]